MRPHQIHPQTSTFAFVNVCKIENQDVRLYAASSSFRIDELRVTILIYKLRGLECKQSNKLIPKFSMK